jgi:cation-transporting ATPase 13A3/4/5
MGFRLFLFGLALAGFGVSWVGEKIAFPRLAKVIGRAKQWLRPKSRKARKQYKLLQTEMRM